MATQTKIILSGILVFYWPNEFLPLALGTDALLSANTMASPYQKLHSSCYSLYNKLIQRQKFTSVARAER